MLKRELMEKTALSRRDFGKLTMAAFGGVVLGSALTGRAAEGDSKHDPSLLLQEKHVCRGLNTCKGKDKSASNSCAGMGNCATYEAHGCDGHNTCKGQGGCGEYAGQNACKGHGSCEVPLKNKAWKAARKAFEKEMTKAGKTFGDAPKKG
jgi:hypothetical protein